MAIEKRHSSRIETTIDTQIIHRGRHFSARAANLSREGLFLRTDALTIPTGMFIDISITLGPHQWQTSGLVIWSCREGVGVVFRISQPELFATALALYPSATQPSFPTPPLFPAAATG